MKEVVVLIKQINGKRKAIAYVNRKKATHDFNTSKDIVEMFTALLIEEM